MSASVRVASGAAGSRTSAATPLAVACGLAAALLAPSAHALSSAEVFAAASPSVWRVATYDNDGLPLAQGSAVVVGEEMLVTNCHVLAKAKRVAVRHEKTSLDAKLQMWDPQRDLCQLRVTGLKAPAVELVEAKSLSVGQTVYAIGSPKGLELTISAGLLSSIRRNDRDQVVLLQTSAAISGGSSGGGLFDDQGRLLGITTLGSVAADIQNINFAVPADWVRELPARHARLTAPKTAAAASAASSPSGASSTAAAAVADGGGGSAGRRVDDDSALPYASAKMREGYRTFLSFRLPRAFAVSEQGWWSYASGSKPKDPAMPSDPAERAMRLCEGHGKGRCFLYAVDDRVVWDDAAATAARQTGR